MDVTVSTEISKTVPSVAPNSCRLLPETLNSGVTDMEYDVRGEIYLKAQQRIAEGKEVILTNVGNPHAVGEKPLTFPRQVLSLCSCPSLLDQPEVLKHFPEDAVERARFYLKEMKGGIGAYSDSRGHMCIRKEIAEFISRRDTPAPPASADDVFITNGGGAGVASVLQTIIRDKNDCILVPLPQYPLYSACITQFGGTILQYELDEGMGWSLNIRSIGVQVRRARTEGKRIRALVVINPGNPTGQCLSTETLGDLLRFATAEGGFPIIADEVYQENIYQPHTRPFVSLRSALHKNGEPCWSRNELISVHTVSKGSFGECGMRCGYLHFHNIHEGTVSLIYKAMSVQLSPVVPSQIILGIMCNPPQPGDASHASHTKERSDIIASLKRRAIYMAEMFNSLEGVTCNTLEGAMYAFPQVQLPDAAVAAAKAAGQAPDMFYALGLLDEVGICVVPGKSFGQADGTFHFRTTILPPEHQMAEMRQKFTQFHQNFMRKHGAPEKLFGQGHGDKRQVAARAKL